MDVQTLGAWGEFVGGIGALVAAIGVIVTLLYLARQVQQNTKSVRSSAYAACMQGNAAVHETHMAAVDVLPDYFYVRAEHWELDSVDYTKFHGHATQVFMQFELVFLLHKDGTVDQEFFDARMGLMKTASQRLPGLLRWWDEWGHVFYDARFCELTDKIFNNLQRKQAV